MDAAGVVAALQSVDEVFRAPLTLFYLEDLSYIEIAEALDVPMGTVMSRLHRGRKAMHKRLYEFAQARGLVQPLPEPAPENPESPAHGRL
jgi:RNA polymerase sigma-70 factor (ECF subfamily)